MAKIDNNKNGAVSKGLAAARCFEREVAKTVMDNVHFPFMEGCTRHEHAKESRYNPYKDKINK